MFILDEIQFTNPITYKLEDLKEETIDGSFYGKELQKATEEVFHIEKVLRRDHKKKLALVKLSIHLCKQQTSEGRVRGRLKKSLGSPMVSLNYKKGV